MPTRSVHYAKDRQNDLPASAEAPDADAQQTSESKRLYKQAYYQPKNRGREQKDPDLHSEPYYDE